MSVAYSLLSLNEIRSALQNGSPLKADELFKLICCMFGDQTSKFSIGVPMGVSTIIQPVSFMRTLNAVAGFSRLVVLESQRGAGLLRLFRNILNGTVSSLAGILPASGAAGNAPTLTALNEVFIEDATGLPGDPVLSQSYTFGRMLAAFISIQADSMSPDRQYMTGTIATGRLGDVRDAMDPRTGTGAFQPTMLKTQSVSPKDGMMNIQAWSGAAITQGPFWTPNVHPVDPNYVGGNGVAAREENILQQGQTFAFSNPIWTIMNNQTTAFYPTTVTPYASVTQSGDTTGLTYKNSVFVSTSFSLQAPGVTNVRIDPIGFNKPPEFTVTCRLPVPTAYATIALGTAEPAVVTLQRQTAASLYSVHLEHLYAQTNDTSTTFQLYSEHVQVPVPDYDPMQPIIQIPQMWVSAVASNQGAMQLNPQTPSGNAYYIGQVQPVKVKGYAKNIVGWTWVGTIISGFSGERLPAFPIACRRSPAPVLSRPSALDRAIIRGSIPLPS